MLVVVKLSLPPAAFLGPKAGMTRNDARATEGGSGGGREHSGVNSISWNVRTKQAGRRITGRTIANEQAKAAGLRPFGTLSKKASPKVLALLPGRDGEHDPAEDALAARHRGFLALPVGVARGEGSSVGRVGRVRGVGRVGGGGGGRGRDGSRGGGPKATDQAATGAAATAAAAGTAVEEGPAAGAAATGATAAGATAAGATAAGATAAGATAAGATAAGATEAVGATAAAGATAAVPAVAGAAAAAAAGAAAGA